MIRKVPSFPLYIQLADLIRSDVEEGRLRSGDRLPTEKELMQLHNLSSTTVRQALGSLVQEGLIYRRAGKGTFVKEPTVERDLVAFLGFSEEMLAKGHRPGAFVLRTGFARPPAWASTALGLDEASDGFNVTRLRSADDFVIAVEEVWFAATVGERLSALGVDLAVTSLTEVLEDRLGLILARASQTIRATAASARVAELLDIAHGSPMLEIDRTAYVQSGDPCYVSRGTYRADRYDYRGWVDRTSPQDAATGTRRRSLAAASTDLPSLGSIRGRE